MSNKYKLQRSASNPAELAHGHAAGHCGVHRVGLNALDGFDVMSISFASTGIAHEWGNQQGGPRRRAVDGTDRHGRRFNFARGLADRIGRRPTVLGCLVLMAVGMFMATKASGFTTCRSGACSPGLGIGGVLAAVNAITAEFSNARRRDACVSFMSIGYPLGAVFGGVIVGQLLKTHDWRSVFYFGSAFTATLIPLVWLLVPESVHWLTRKQPAGALTRINHSMKRIGLRGHRHPPAAGDDRGRRGRSGIFLRRVSWVRPLF